MIDESGNQIGVIATDIARKMAYEKGLDLVEVAPESKPPVCKIIDYGKYKYQLNKQHQKSKKKQHFVRVKEVQLRPRTGKHDVEVKANHSRQFIKHGDKVLVRMRFRGRELAHRDIGWTVLEQFAKSLEDIAKLEKRITREGRGFIMILTPK